MIAIKIIAALLLFIAVAPLPYGYYIFLRWVITIIAAISAIDSLSKEKVSWIWVFACIVILFNPIVPIYLTKGIWMPIDIIAAIIFLASIGAVKRVENK